MDSFEPNANDLQQSAISIMSRILDYRSSVPLESESRNSTLPTYIGLAVSAINFIKYASQLTTQTASRLQVRITNLSKFSLYIYKTNVKNVSRPKYEIEIGQTTIVDVSNLNTAGYKQGGRLSFGYKDKAKDYAEDFTIFFNYHDSLPVVGVDVIMADQDYKNPYITEPYPDEEKHPYISFWAASINNGIVIYANHIYSNDMLTKNVTTTTLELIIL